MNRPTPERLERIIKIAAHSESYVPTVIRAALDDAVAEIAALTAERDDARRQRDHEQQAKLGEREHYRAMRDRRKAELVRAREVADAAQRLYDGACADRDDAEGRATANAEMADELREENERLRELLGAAADAEETTAPETETQWGALMPDGYVATAKATWTRARAERHVAENPGAVLVSRTRIAGDWFALPETADETETTR